MSLIFWDTNLFIYLMEEHPDFGERAAWIRRRMIERRDRLCTSALTVAELLTGPYPRTQDSLAANYKEALRPPKVEVLSFTPETAERYARIRTDRAISPADAIQLRLRRAGARRSVLD